jgi:hypothetical protein
MGKNGIDAASTREALNLTLGVDSRVAVKREKVNEMSSTKLPGNDVNREYTYKITVRNNHNSRVYNISYSVKYPEAFILNLPLKNKFCAYYTNMINFVPAIYVWK